MDQKSEEHHPKKYYDKKRTLRWGENIPPKELTALRNGEIFTLLDGDGKPYSRVLADSFNVLREQKL